jgi:hypothetical protein
MTEYAQKQAAPQSGDTPPTRVSAKSRYNTLVTDREPFLKRAREVAELTIPALMPPAGHSNATVLPTPWQSIGADGINSLASKLLLAILPPGTSFFRLTMDDFVVEKLEGMAGGGQQGKDARGKFEAALGKIERAVINRLEQVGARIPVFEALKQLLAAGNGLIQMLPKGRIRLHYLDHYVVKRDPSGNLLEVIVWEPIAYAALTKEAREVYESSRSAATNEQAGGKAETTVDLYTRVVRGETMWEVCQEIGEAIIPSSEGTYPLEKSPWIPLRYTRIDGEDYGRGRGEEYLGDLRSLEYLSQSVVEGTAIMAKILFLMNPGGVTMKEDLVKASNGAVIDGDLKDIGVLKVDKLPDFQVAAATIDKLEKRLGKAFMVTEVRDAERVTAEEIRMLAQELEKTLGGVYAILSQELQLPLVSRLMFLMQQEKALPALPEKLVAPQVVTGLEALGRSSDYQKLREFVAETGQELGPEVVAQYINVGDYLRRKGTALQIDLEGLIKPEEQVQQELAQQRQMETVNKLGGPAMQALAKQQPAGAPQAPQQ